MTETTTQIASPAKQAALDLLFHLTEELGDGVAKLREAIESPIRCGSLDAKNAVISWKVGDVDVTAQLLAAHSATLRKMLSSSDAD